MILILDFNSVFLHSRAMITQIKKFFSKLSNNYATMYLWNFDFTFHFSFLSPLKTSENLWFRKEGIASLGCLERKRWPEIA